MPEPSMLSYFRFYLHRQPCLEYDKKNPQNPMSGSKAVIVFRCPNITYINQVHTIFISNTQPEFYDKILFRTCNLPFICSTSPLLVLVGYAVQIINYISNIVIMNIYYLHSVTFYLYSVTYSVAYSSLFVLSISMCLSYFLLLFL